MVTEQVKISASLSQKDEKLAGDIEKAFNDVGCEDMKDLTGKILALKTQNINKNKLLKAQIKAQKSFEENQDTQQIDKLTKEIKELTEEIKELTEEIDELSKFRSGKIMPLADEQNIVNQIRNKLEGVVAQERGHSEDYLAYALENDDYLKKAIQGLMKIETGKEKRLLLTIVSSLDACRLCSHKVDEIQSTISQLIGNSHQASVAEEGEEEKAEEVAGNVSKSAMFKIFYVGNKAMQKDNRKGSSVTNDNASDSETDVFNVSGGVVSNNPENHLNLIEIVKNIHCFTSANLKDALKTTEEHPTTTPFTAELGSAENIVGKEQQGATPD